MRNENMRNITLAGIILLVLAAAMGTGAADTDQTNVTGSSTETFTAGNVTEGVNAVDDGIPHYDPESAWYGWMIALDNIRVTFTFNKVEKLEKQMAHARQRLAEANAELRKNNTEASARALELYSAKMEKINESISGLSGNDEGIFHAQEMIVKHQLVLERLLASHPNNTGIERALDNSHRLEKKFELKTQRKLEHMTGKVLRKETEVKVRAEIIGNVTQVKVEVKFVANSTERNATAQEILNKLQLSRENISGLLKIEEEEAVTGAPTETLTAKPEERLEAKARVEGDVSEVEAKLRFSLNVTNRTEIVEGIYQRLSALTTEEILKALELKTKEERKERQEVRKEERGKIKEEHKNRGTDSGQEKDR